MASADDWRSPKQRQTVIDQIENWMKRYGNPTRKRGVELEEQMFARAVSKDDYLQMIARLMVHIRVLHGSSGCGTGNNATQDGLTAQGTDLQGRVQVGPSYNLQPLQTQLVSQASQHQLQDSGVQSLIDTTASMNNPTQLILQPNVAISTAPQNKTVLPMSSLPGGARLLQAGQSSLNQSVMPSTSANAIAIQQSEATKQALLAQQQNNSLAQQQRLRQQQQQQQQPPSSQQQFIMSHGNQNQQKYLGNLVGGTSTPISTATLPNLPSQLTNTSQFGVPKSLQPPTTQSASTSNKPTPSPAPYSEPSMSPMIPTSSPLPTPGSAQSPLNPEDEQAYVDKIKELSKYIEPLKKIISQIPKTDDHKLQRDKMIGLLDTLTLRKRVQPSSLEKSEKILAKLLSSSLPAPQSAPLTTTHAPPQVPNTSSASVPPLTGKGVVQPWTETLNSLAPDPRLPIVARQAISPALNVMSALTIGPLRPPIKRRKLHADAEQKNSAIPHALKMEIADLWHRFHITCVKTPVTEKNLVVLSCKTKNKCLPPLPPMVVKIPRLYPKQQAEYVLSNYDSSPFLENVKCGLMQKLLRTVSPQPFTSILIAWEESILEACDQEDLFTIISEEKF